jgi:hypothetical protein
MILETEYMAGQTIHIDAGAAYDLNTENIFRPAPQESVNFVPHFIPGRGHRIMPR